MQAFFEFVEGPGSVLFLFVIFGFMWLLADLMFNAHCRLAGVKPEDLAKTSDADSGVVGTVFLDSGDSGD